MAKKVGNYLIPFDQEGNQQYYAAPACDGTWNTLDHHKVGLDWRSNEPFQDTLTYVTFERGRSAAYFKFKRLNGNHVYVFMKEMSEMIPHMVNGQITGNFAFVKRGENYGCTMQN